MKKEEKVEFIRYCLGAFCSFTISEEVALFMACQFALESAFGTSPRSVTHNLCGMKTPAKRLSTVSPTSAGEFMCYANDKLCFIDYLLWLSYYRFSQKDLHDLSLFKAKLVQSGYCPEMDYVSKIESLFNQFSYVID